MTGIYQVYTIFHIPFIYLVYTCHMNRHSIPGIYLVYTFPMKLWIAMQQHTGIGLQGCLMFCRMWRRCHWASVSQPEGRAVARLGPRRQSRAAYVGGTAATDAHCSLSGGGADISKSSYYYFTIIPIIFYKIIEIIAKQSVHYFSLFYYYFAIIVHYSTIIFTIILSIILLLFYIGLLFYYYFYYYFILLQIQYNILQLF